MFYFSMFFEIKNYDIIIIIDKLLYLKYIKITSQNNSITPLSKYYFDKWIWLINTSSIV